jgi:acetyl-CoA carboxylase biotin carboxyl carrier protein
MPHVSSPMAGTVFKIVVAVGDALDFGQTIVILESMKMEIGIESDGSGTVKAIRVQEGTTVDQGDPLIDYE